MYIELKKVENKSMKISTKGRYALEIAADLARYSDREHPESLKNIAVRRGLSEKYLERIMKMLRDAGLVLSVRGTRGGYCLAAPPDEITAYDVLCAAEGELAPVACLTRETDCGIECGKCPTQAVWKDMWEIIRDTAKNVTIGQIIKCEEEMGEAWKTAEQAWKTAEQK